MAEVTNPRATATNTNRGGLTGDAARLADIRVQMNSLQATINANKPGTKKYEDALKKFKALKAEKERLEAKGKAGEAAKKKAKTDAAIQQAEEDLQRATDTGDQAAADAAKRRLEGLQAESEKQSYNQQREQQIAAEGTKGTVSKFTGSGTTDKPLEKDGKLFTGTYKGKKYQNGILVKDTVVTGDKGKGTTGDAGAGDGDKDKNKTLWVSYLRTTFAALDNKEQKAEIDLLFKTALKEGWDEKTFMEALEGTKWWQATFPSLRQFFLESNDPRNAGTFAQKVSNNVDDIMAKLEALGITPQQVDPQTGRLVDNTDFIRGIALEAIKNNWDDNQLESYLSTKGNFLFTGGGTIGSYMDRIKSTAYLYGINVDANLQQAINTSLLDPLDGRDYNYWVNSMKQMALDAPQNKPFAEALKSGRSLYEVTSSYRNQMANLLEVDSTAITWDDLMSKVLDKDSGNARTFADFTKALKQDPLWQYTRNAKETYSGMALDLAKMFGFAG